MDGISLFSNGMIRMVCIDVVPVHFMCTDATEHEHLKHFWYSTVNSIAG